MHSWQILGQFFHDLPNLQIRLVDPNAQKLLNSGYDIPGGIVKRFSIRFYFLTVLS